MKCNDYAGEIQIPLDNAATGSEVQRPVLLGWSVIIYLTQG